MNDFDKYIKNKASEENADIPNSVKTRIEETLSSLPEKKQSTKHIRILPRIFAIAACFIFITVFLLPNVSITYAQALEQIPVISDIIQVVTIRNYFYSDDKHAMNINVPQISGDAGKAADFVNKDVNELTTILVDKFYKELETEKAAGYSGYGSVDVDYETITNTERWFTLKLSVCETAASSNNYFKFYNIDIKNNKLVKIKDLFNTDDFSDTLVKEIKKQMQEQMSQDEGITYWINSDGIGEDFVAVGDDRNFYWNQNGDLVIVFDKYEVGPGAIGTPEFVIGKEVIDNILKSEYRLITSE